MAESSPALLQDSASHPPISNGLTNGVTNGTSNGISDSSSKDKDKDRHKSSHKDKDRDRDRHSSSHKSSHKEKDRDKHRSSSSSGDKHKSSSDKDRDRSSDKDQRKSSSSSGDKDKHRDKDKHKSSSSSSDKYKECSKDKERSDKDKERSDKNKERSDKDKERSDKDKERSDKDKERSIKDKERSDKDKERRDKDKEKERNKDKERSDKDKERSKDKEKSDKDRHRSSSDKDKKHSSSSSEKKDKDKERDRHHSSSKSSHKDKHREKDRPRDKDKDKHREEKKDRESSAGDHGIKQEPMDATQNTSLELSQDSVDASFRNHSQNPGLEMRDGGAGSAAESEEDKLIIEEPIPAPVAAALPVDHDDVPLSFVKKEVKRINYAEEEDEEEDLLLSTRKRAVKEESDEDFVAENNHPGSDEDSDDVPLAAHKRPKVEPEEEDDDDDIPLAARKKPKKEALSDDDDIPLSARKKQQPKKKRKKPTSEDEEEDDFKPKAKKAKVKKEKKTATPKRASTGGGGPGKSPTKKVKKESEEEKNVWKWWEEEKNKDGRKWTFLEHKGVVFADPYERLPPNILMKYDGKPMVLAPASEEVAGFYAKMLEHDYVTKEQFNKNFFRDFRKSMNATEREVITDLSKCDFKKMAVYYTQKNEERKNRTKDEKKTLKESNEALIKEYGWCIIDGHKQRIANFKAEPPGLFRGRGDHPKMGMLKHRIMPEDVIINCSKDSKIPEPPQGHKWKEVRHDNQVTWLASWTENVQGQTKYVMMNAASKLKGEKDWQKYETARRLHQIVGRIRDQYQLDWKSKEMRIRQRSVALYFIDKLALRAGNEKDEDQADTVGCCSLRVEHITLHDKKDGKECVVAFDFLGKDSIRYYNEVPVEKRAFKNVRLFMENKAPGDDLFDRLNTQIMNKHLNELMEGLTAKVFRTYNASRTLQEQLNKLTDSDDDISAKVLSYNRANREVAILCNHQRAVPKTFDQSMANLQKKIDEKKDLIEEAEKDLKTLKRQAKSGGSMAEKSMYDKKKKQLERLNEQLHKLDIQATDKQENKQIALGTSKLNYLDPRISVAWCKKHDVPLDKVYNKTQRLKFQWAIEMATDDYDFTEPPKSKFTPVQNDTTNDDDEEADDDYS